MNENTINELLTHEKIKLKNQRKKTGGIFDEAMLLGAKGLILIIIITGFAITVLSVISKFSGLMEIITQELPDY